MVKTPLLSVVLAAVLLSGCAAVPFEPADLENSRTYSASREVVWRRILATSAREAMFVKQADRANGVITVEREIASPEGSAILNWADCGWSGLERPLSQRVELSFVVRQAPTGTAVTVNGRFRELRQNIPQQTTQWANCASTGVLERKLLDAFHYD